MSDIIHFVHAVKAHVAGTGGLIRLVISLECFIEITPDFLCPFMNYTCMHSKFQSHSYCQSLVIAV